jgi:hypothetical protein
MPRAKTTKPEPIAPARVTFIFDCSSSVVDDLIETLTYDLPFDTNVTCCTVEVPASEARTLDRLAHCRKILTRC